MNPVQKTHEPDPRLLRAVRQVALVAALLVLCLPVARGDSAWFGPLPLWLLGMPLLSWWSLHRFRLPARVLPASAPLRRGRPQARRIGRADARWSRGS